MCLAVGYIFAYRLPLTAYCAVTGKTTPWVAAKQARIAETHGTDVGSSYGSSHNPRSLRGFFASWWGDLWEDMHAWRAERRAGQPERRAEREARRRNGESRMAGVRGGWQRLRDWLRSLRRAGRGDRSGWLPQWLPLVDRPDSPEGEHAVVPEAPEVALADTDEALAWALNDTDTYDPDARVLVDRAKADLGVPVPASPPPDRAAGPAPASPAPSGTEPAANGNNSGNPAPPRPAEPMSCAWLDPIKVGDDIVVGTCSIPAAPDKYLCDYHLRLIDAVRTHTGCRWEIGVKPPCPNPIDPHDGMFCTEHVNALHRRYLASLDPAPADVPKDDVPKDSPSEASAEPTPAVDSGAPAVPPATPQAPPSGRPHLTVVPNPDPPALPSGRSEGVPPMADTKTAPGLTAEEAASVQALDLNADDMLGSMSNQWPSYIETVENNVVAAGLAGNKAVKTAIASFDEAVGAARAAAQALKTALKPQVDLANNVSETEDHGTNMKAYENTE